MRDVIGAYPWYRCLHSPEPVSAYSKGSLSLKPLGLSLVSIGLDDSSDIAISNCLNNK